MGRHFSTRGVTGVVVLIVAKANVRHRHPKGESKKTGLKACAILRLS